MNIYIVIGINSKEGIIGCVGYTFDSEEVNRYINKAKEEGFNDFFILQTNESTVEQRQKLLDWTSKYDLNTEQTKAIFAEITNGLRKISWIFKHE